MKEIILKEYNKELDERIQDLMEEKVLAHIKYEFLKLIELKLDEGIENYRGSHIYPHDKGLVLSVVFKADGLPIGYKEGTHSLLGGPTISDKTKKRLQEKLTDDIYGVLNTFGEHGVCFGHGRLVDYTNCHYPHDPYNTDWESKDEKAIERKKYQIADQVIENNSFQKGEWYHPVFFDTRYMWFPDGKHGSMPFEKFIELNSKIFKGE